MLTRRHFLAGSATAATGLAIPNISFAAAKGDNRLIVLILRGGMDGLHIVQPYGDKQLKALRPKFANGPADGLTDLDGFFGLHKTMKPVASMFKSGELGFVHAVSTPYAARSHFDGQDVLEAGTNSISGIRDGWLNRFLGALPNASQRFALDVSKSQSLILKGDRPVTRWHPDADLDLSEVGEELLRMVYAEDPLFKQAFEAAIMAEASDIDGLRPIKREAARNAALLVAKMLNAEARIASLTVPGWDTHAWQGKRINRPIKTLTTVLNTLKRELGANWERTAVIAVSEFGRTVRENGTGGTDHGYGGLMMLAGGAVKDGIGGRVISSRWPGLADGDLYEQRDLQPTDDVRRYMGWVLAGLFPTDKGKIEREVFPGVDMGDRLPLV